MVKNLFYLPALMRVPNLDVRYIAETSKELTAEEYFYLLEEFLRLAPKAADALTQIGGGADDALSEVTNIIPALEKIGCLFFAPYLRQINTDAPWEKQKKARITASLFTRFYTHIKTLSNIPPLLIDDAGPVNKQYTAMCALPLKAVIARLDNIEITRPLQILAVDDAPFMLQSITGILGAQYRVFALIKPAMVDTLLLHITPELFLLDYKMPDMSGFELINIIRSHSEHKKTPVIFLTSTDSPEVIEQALNLGASDYITKPFKQELLLKKVRRHIKRV